MVRGSRVAGLRCTALCLHQNMITLCNQHFGQAVGSEGDGDFDTVFISVRVLQRLYMMHDGKLFAAGMVNSMESRL